MALTSLTIDSHVATLAIEPRDGYADRALVEALTTACRMVASDTERIRAVVLQSRGAHFCRGWSANVLAERHQFGVPVAPLGAVFEALAALPQPTVAAIEGSAHSAGLEFALACDIRVADADATFGMPEVALGQMPRGGATQRLPRAVGRAAALRMLLTGATIDAPEAHRIGLVSEVVSSGATVSAATAIARTIASRGPIATRLVKEAVYRGIELPLEHALRYELDLTVLLQTTEDRAEGVRAFIEQRPPHFTGA